VQALVAEIQLDLLGEFGAADRKTVRRPDLSALVVIGRFLTSKIDL